ncbi:sigma-54 interaction domain-containing protein [Pseudotabrizicola algicola]|uniref:Nif-specific regulatory protein n=1 Tax=Pseudotabrizicola algicola TaxID=2709381 RepID=A0A6B3RK43_9RHOB|nr:sigma-54 dependent transcriptional regulator [Pseudotabrizicola algicola]NEX45268.1 sigma-54-dependent Fis family transcriptional regulator [Pseudotabrizicola algicola]
MTSHWIMPPSEQPLREAPVAIADRLIPGRSGVMRAMKRLIATMAPDSAPVLITGPSGAGKELVAEALHRLSGRTGEFVAVNCAAIPAELLEGELFGTERGAYTGADRARAGLIEQAEGGTLFLDEIGDMPASLQAKLLRVLETRMVRRLGGSAPVQMNFRLVAATHRNLAEMARAGSFREDLYYRLAVFPVEVPPLSARLSDLPDILEHLLDDRAMAHPGQPLPEFDATALRALTAHDWPGNIRELKTVLLRACLLFPGKRVGAREVRDNLMGFCCPEPASEAEQDHCATRPEEAGLPPIDLFHQALGQGQTSLDLRGYLRDIEVALISAALERSGNCVSRTADTLRLNRTTLIEKIRKYGIATR